MPRIRPEKNNVLTKEFFCRKLFNEGRGTMSLLSKKEIDSISKHFKNNVNGEYGTFEEFLESFPNYKKIVDLKSLRSILEKKFKRIKSSNYDDYGLQPGNITECVLAATIAEVFNLNIFYDNDNNQESNYPLDLVNKIFKVTPNKDGATPRFIYTNEKKNILYFQYGSADTIDSVFIRDSDVLRLELKEAISRMGEFDILYRDKESSKSYDENGKILYDSQFELEHPQFIKYIDIFNRTTNVFEQKGKNFNLKDYITNLDKEWALKEYVDTSDIDVFIVLKGKKIYAILPSYLIKFSDFSSSEIRTSGRNKSKVFTPNYLLRILKEKAKEIEPNVFKLVVRGKDFRKGRGTNAITRVSVEDLFFVSMKDLKPEISNDKLQKGIEIIFPLDKVWQKRVSMSFHLKISPNKEVLSEMMNNFT